jgi:hypothetical protein
LSSCWDKNGYNKEKREVKSMYVVFIFCDYSKKIDVKKFKEAIDDIYGLVD